MLLKAYPFINSRAMKPLYIIVLFMSILQTLFGQNSFVLNIEQSEVDAICDGVQLGDRFYFIQVRGLNPRPPYDFDKYSDLLVTTENGSLIEKIKLGDLNTHYQRVLKVTKDEIYLVGCIRTDSCLSKIVISRFNINTHNLEHLSSYDLCENIVAKIKIVDGLDGKIFIEESHTIGEFLTKKIFLMDSTYHLSIAKDSVHYSNCFSVDFSRKGYLICADKLKRFYDADFNFRKQKWFYEEVDSENESQKPFRDYLILIQTLQDRSDKPDFGFQLLLIDSLLHVVKKTVILPTDVPVGGMYTPFFGGVEVKNSNEIWTTGYSYRDNEIEKGSFFVTKLDSNLNILCQHFIGFDSWYRIYGIRVLDSGGALIYGSRLRNGHNINEGEDIYAIRVGENCEIPITSIKNENETTILSISAYPNPGINDLAFSVNGFDPYQLSVELFDESGKVLFSKKDLTNSIQVPDLPAGQYFYRIMDKEKLLGVGAWVKQ